MLRGLLGFGKDGRPQPPKGKIEVACPTCGAFQYEPRLVVSTLCKKCGDHLRIEHKRAIGTGVRHDIPAGEEASAPSSSAGDVVKKESASANAPPLSAAGGSDATMPAAAQPTIIARPVKAGPAGKRDDIAAEKPRKRKSATGEARQDESDSGAGPDRSVVDQVPERGEGRDKEPRPHSHMPAPTPSPPPASASTLQKMKEQGFYRQQYFKDAHCFDCGHSFKVGRSSRSANCPQCGSWISMEDVEINMNSTHAIKTRGDVIIRKRGHLSTSSVQCKDLHCQGLLEANVKATGDAAFRTHGTVVGEVRCHRLVIEKGADVSFTNPVYADQVEIHARITATVFARGPVLITAYGAVDGDVTARSVSIEPGGELNGAMNIVRGETALFEPLTSA